ncbi:MAG TPA: 3-keto-5-aminohexanoate cleavage protein [Anaerolineae bacterium]|nr:3-keto-5-aminohexanoate cleavage protein [Anaerolineae bacterium]
MDKLIITAAVTGSITDRSKNPNHPMTPQEIANAAVDSWRAGAAIIHLHARADDGTPTQDAARFADLIERIRSTGCDAILNLSTGSAGGRATFEERLACLALAPELASFDCGSVNFETWTFLNPPHFLQDMAKRMLEYRVKAEIECFDIGMIYAGRRLGEQKLLPPPLYFQFVMGTAGGIPAEPQHLVEMVACLPPGATWSVCALGRGQLPMNVMAILMGGHARTGLEDNVYYAHRVPATSNAQLVERLVRLSQELGRPVASPNEAREILGLQHNAQD